ncbi:type II toxin-antitoxin system TacA family antitoxin [Spiribacter halobius]|nr:DUF1778 domain-containing protein [Spiribacter halobius]UEX77264.1 DUF1778 domain-containing protein [Spiribacter halobius]
MYIRTSQAMREQVSRAAALSGQGVSEYVRDVLAREARRTIEAHETIAIAEGDRDAFIEAMRKPPAWPEHMKAKVRRYRERIASE